MSVAPVTRYTKGPLRLSQKSTENKTRAPMVNKLTLIKKLGAPLLCDPLADVTLSDIFSVLLTVIGYSGPWSRSHQSSITEPRHEEKEMLWAT